MALAKLPMPFASTIQLKVQGVPSANQPTAAVLSMSVTV
jgi:hypothetical protein